jgi:hypothetical protein
MALIPASIAELFRSPAAPAPLSTAQQQAVNNGGDLGTGAGNNPASPTNNPTVPSDATPASDGSVAAIPKAGEGNQSPLDNYKDLWQVRPKLSNVETITPDIVADPGAMMKVAQQFDFTKGMDPELFVKATSGDKEAFASVINSAVQAGFAQAAIASANITKAALAAQAQSFETKYAPEMFRNADITSQVNNTVPLSQDPGAAPIIAALRTQLSAKFPTATPQEIAVHTNNYLAQFAQKAIESAGGKVILKSDMQTQANPLAKPDTDWEKFFSM